MSIEVLDFHIQFGSFPSTPEPDTVSILICETKKPSDILEISFTFITIPASAEKDVSIIESFELFQNYPNPFNPESKIRYSIPAGHAHISQTIYNETDQLNRTLINQIQAPGLYDVMWNDKTNCSNKPQVVFIFPSCKMARMCNSQDDSNALMN